jgi:hypothetical protein
MAIATLADVPLWKVIAGPMPANCNRTRKGPVFFCVQLYCASRPAISAYQGATHRSIAPTRTFSETAISMMMTTGTKLVVDPPSNAPSLSPTHQWHSDATLTRI